MLAVGAALVAFKLAGKKEEKKEEEKDKGKATAGAKKK